MEDQDGKLDPHPFACSVRPAVHGALMKGVAGSACSGSREAEEDVPCDAMAGHFH